MFYKSTLANGIRVITQEMPSVYSVTASIWVGTGSAYETPALAGISHFLEHMMFKGTKNRSYTEIAQLMENVGGQMNAFTSKEHTCYYVRCLAENFELGLDILSDMYLNSLFDKSEYDKEQGVILEEINMYEDTPDEMVGDLYNSLIMPEHPYGRPVIGSIETVSAMTRDDIAAYHSSIYVPGQTVVVVAGNVKHQAVVNLVEKYLGEHTGTWSKPVLPAPVYAAQSKHTYKEIEQVHVMMGVPALAGNDPDIYKLQVLNYILGGGLCSRLFQEVREKRGLTYSVYSSPSALSHGGTFYAYASTSPKNVDELLKVMGCEIAKLAAEPVSEQELLRAQAQVKCGLLMGLENSGNIMVRLGRNETAYGEVLKVEEIIEKVSAVTAEDVLRMAQRLFVADKLCLAQVGPVASDLAAKDLLQC